MEARLRDAETRNAAIGVLSAIVFDDSEGPPYAAARLLLTNRATATPRLLDVLDRVAQAGNALGPLALLAWTARVEDARAAAGERRPALRTISEIRRNA